MVVPVTPPPISQTPGWLLPEITLRSAAFGPPITLPGEFSWTTTPAPSPEFGIANVPVGSVPIRFPRITLFGALTTLTPLKRFPLMTFPATVTPDAPLISSSPLPTFPRAAPVGVRPVTAAGTLRPSSRSSRSRAGGRFARVRDGRPSQDWRKNIGADSFGRGSGCRRLPASGMAGRDDDRVDRDRTGLLRA